MVQLDFGLPGMVAKLRGLLLAFLMTAFGGTTMAADLENTLYLDVPAGRVVKRSPAGVTHIGVARPRSR